MDILGHIFEQSITDLERLRNEWDGVAEPKYRVSGDDRQSLVRIKFREWTLSLDARIPLDAISDESRRATLREWLTTAAREARVSARVAEHLNGAVFEVRQGYKSKDSKRQNADIGNAANAYAHSYLPVVLLLSGQIDSDIEERYARAQWTILRGVLAGTPWTSSYVFSEKMLGYDLAAFFRRNSPAIKAEVQRTIQDLLE